MANLLAHDLDFAGALEAAEAIRQKQVSSIELTRRVFDRIDRYNPQLNAFVYQLRDSALQQAEAADVAMSQGRSLGVFHGVPFSVKESFGVAGKPSTWGLAPFRDSKAPANAEAVSRLLNAGAVLVGATNVPVALSDFQSDNPIYGRSNSPWNPTLTPGGSSGGSAAALAAGLGYLSVGSDIGGSIRGPVHFCGIFGHKPTLDLVSMAGHLAGGAATPPGFSSLLAVAGPMARTAGDLMAALKILGGPVAWDAKAWKWELPPSRGQSLKDFRIGYVIDDPIAPPMPEVKTQLEAVIERLSRAGARLTSGWPSGIDPVDLFAAYLFHLDAFLYSVQPPDQQARLRETYAGSEHHPGGLSSFADWQRQNIRRLAFRAKWQAWFQQFDVFLSPVAYTTAFPHDASQPQEGRTIATSTGPRPYMDLLKWIAPASLTGCPATVAPAGLTKSGLPIGIQIMGPFWEDATTITFADLLSKEIGGFVAPPGYGD